jgi:hypothetical protein
MGSIFYEPHTAVISSYRCFQSFIILPVPQIPDKCLTTLNSFQHDYTNSPPVTISQQDRPSLFLGEEIFQLQMDNGLHRSS